MLVVVTAKGIHPVAQFLIGFIRRSTCIAESVVLLERFQSFQLTPEFVPLPKRFLLRPEESFALFATSHVPSISPRTTAGVQLWCHNFKKVSACSTTTDKLAPSFKFATCGVAHV
jgi:hypothetical protein